MKKYTQVDMNEKGLEDLVSQGAELIEPGLLFVDHQRTTDKGRMDVLFVDSGQSLVIAELKIVEDDNMLLQALDYFDYVSSNIESLARVYKNFKIDPTKPIRIMLIAPSFSQTLINRSKWIDASISLFIYKCIQFEDSSDVVPVFNEISIPTPKDIIEEKYTLDDRINYITIENVKIILKDFIKLIQNKNPDKIKFEPIKHSISVKISNNVFMYLSPRRDKFLIEMNDQNGKWSAYPVNSNDDIQNLLELVESNINKKSR
ncbi:hypothetical protein [Leptospira meyeri]|uniref:hypothetical protein n=1 Tax=Leptospira meyeri TaxID=29508 RepID=UPI0002BF9C7A|nr:hypothetical protein [Leptospira meyeri]EMJ89495.1 hypothetical protein LEP1GSC196_0002 [Leptospira meyeri serovar Semaranga str. Veldrot Semarang 173]